MMTMNTERKSLREFAKEMGTRLPFMDEREKGSTDELLGQVSTIVDYGFIPNDDGELYAAFIVRERSTKFYFGGTVLTDRLMKMDDAGYGEDIRAEGLPILMTKATSKKSKRSYTDVKFYPEG